MVDSVDTKDGDNSRNACGPREYFRLARPEQFSDTLSRDEPVVDRAQLEYYLDTLTNRQQEAEFETFARKLAERELCPNLRPMTGPVGGGDSKVDTSTYVVATELARRVWWGLAKVQTDARWVFAFSAKKTWTEKVRSDARAAASTSPRPARIYFITSRFTRDKTRDDIQVALTKELGIPVEILDRNWIVDRVQDRHHYDLVIDYLRLPVRSVSKPRGRLDTRRDDELTQILARLNRPDKHPMTPAEICIEYLRAARLSRELERSAAETRALLAKAQELADEVGHLGQRVTVVYQSAWTALFWHEDRDELLRCLAIMRPMAEATRDAMDLDLIARVLMIAWAEERRGGIPSGSVNRAWLDAALKRIEAERARPGNAAHARAIRLSMTVTSDDVGERESAFRDLVETIEGAATLAVFPLADYIHCVMDLGDIVAALGSCDDLFDRVAKLVGRVNDADSGARLLLRRGEQLLRAGRPRKAIASLGHASNALARASSRELGLKAALLCGEACRELRLPWAARAQYLFGLHAVAQDLKSNPVFPHVGRVLLRALTHVELGLGRIAATLAGVELLGATAVPCASGESDPAEQEARDRDAILSLYLLSVELPVLERVLGLSSTLRELGLDCSAGALAFATGDLDALGLGGDREAQAEEFFNKLLAQPAASEIAPRATLGLPEEWVEYHADVIGMTVIVEFRTSAAASVAAEDILAVLQAMLATATWEHVLPTVDRLVIRLVPDNVDRQARFIGVGLGVGSSLEVRFTDQLDAVPKTFGEPAYVEELLKVLAWVLSCTHPLSEMEGPERLLNQMGEESGFTRALQLVPSHLTIRDLFGVEKTYTVEPWLQASELTIKRQVRWLPDESLERTNLPTDGPAQAILAPINAALWNATKWVSAVYIVDPDCDNEPLFLLGFADRGTAEAIFEEWKDQRAEGHLAVANLQITIAYEARAGVVVAYCVIVGVDIAGAMQKMPASGHGVQAIVVVKSHEFDCIDTAAFRGLESACRSKGTVTLGAAVTLSDGRTQAIGDARLENVKVLIRAASEFLQDDVDSPEKRWVERWVQARAAAKPAQPSPEERGEGVLRRTGNAQRAKQQRDQRTARKRQRRK